MSEDKAYVSGAALLLEVERKFEDFAADQPDRADALELLCALQLATIRPHDQSATPSCGAMAIIGHLGSLGMIDDNAAAYALIFVGAMQRAERGGPDATAQEGCDHEAEGSGQAQDVPRRGRRAIG